MSLKIASTSKGLLRLLVAAMTTPGARYHLSWEQYKGKDYGHILTCERTAEGLILYDPQANSFEALEAVVEQVAQHTELMVLRVDGLLVQADLLRQVCAPSE